MADAKYLEDDGDAVYLIPPESDLPQTPAEWLAFVGEQGHDVVRCPVCGRLQMIANYNLNPVEDMGGVEEMEPPAEGESCPNCFTLNVRTE